MGTQGLVRSSRDGDQFHYLWAARQCLKLLPGSTDLVAVSIEGATAAETVGDEIDAGEEIIDVGLYFGAEERGDARLVRYVQLKHSTRRAFEPWTASGLKKTIKGFADRYAEIAERYPADDVAQRFRFEFTTNRPIDGRVKEALADLASERDARHPDLHGSLIGYTTLDGDRASRFFRLFSAEGGEGDLWAQKNLLDHDFRDYLPDADYDAPVQLKELVTRKATSEFEANPAIRRHDVLRALKVTEEQLQPAPCLIPDVSNTLPREQEQDILGALLAAERPVVIHADGGVGKSVLAGRLAASMPSGSEAILYDCFGDGLYGNALHFRHRHRDALVQIANELAARGLCYPLIPTVHADAKQYMRAFVSRLAQAVKLLRARNPEAHLCLIIDAADNAEMAAEEPREPASFVRDLIQPSLPDGVRLALTCRTDRRWRLRAPLGTQEIGLRPFTESESGNHLRGVYPSASDAEVAEFALLSSSNPRVQALALSRRLSLQEMLKQLRSESPTVDRAIGELLDSAVAQPRHINDSNPRPFVFIARDFGVQVQAVIGVAIDLVADEFEVFDPERDSLEQAHIPTTVWSKLQEADRVIAYLDKNNVNVAFEVGYALGLGKPVALAYKTESDQGGPSHWKSRSVLQNHSVRSAGDFGDLVAVIRDFSSQPPVPTPAPRDDARTLLLCPDRGEGGAILHRILALHPTWEPISSVSLEGITSLAALGVFGRSVWIIPQDLSSPDTRDDGVENTSNALYAGYLTGIGRRPRIFGHEGFRGLVDIDDWVVPYSSDGAILAALQGPGGPPATAFPSRSARASAGLAHAAELAAVLARHLPEFEVFEQVAENLGIPVDHRGATPLSRWEALAEECVLRGEAEVLVDWAERTAAERDAADGGRRADELKADLPAPYVRLGREPVLGAEWTVFRSVADRVEGLRPTVLRLPRTPGEPAPHDPVVFFSRFGLLRTWGSGAPDLPELGDLKVLLDSAWSSNQAILEKARDEGWFVGESEWSEPHLGTAVAAWGLVAEFARAPADGLRRVRWMLDQLHRLGATRRELLGLVLRWWPPACDAAAAWEAETLESDPWELDPEGRRDVLLRLSRCDALLAQIGAAPWADPSLAIPGTPPRCAAAQTRLSAARAPSVEWALRSGQARYLAYLLESLGEQRTGTYAGLLPLAEPEGEEPLARALLRLAREAVDEPVLPEGPWGDAIRALLPRYGPAARRRLQDPGIAVRWLQLVHPPYTDDDLAVLVSLFHRFGSHGLLGASALARLALEPRLDRVWTGLRSTRRLFIDELARARQLCQPNVAALVRGLRMHPPLDPGERADAEVLVTRHQHALDACRFPVSRE